MNIHFISPYSYDLKIGDALNRDISRLPDDSWIVHCDQDTLKPPGFAERIREVLLNAKPSQDMVLTCMTNRSNSRLDCVINDLYDEGHIGIHLNTAASLWKKHKTDIVPTEVAPGYCMVFHKMNWLELGGWPASCISFDVWLSKRSTPMLMKGVYIVHLYRWPKPITWARRSTKHLLIPGSLLR